MNTRPNPFDEDESPYNEDESPLDDEDPSFDDDSIDVDAMDGIEVDVVDDEDIPVIDADMIDDRIEFERGMSPFPVVSILLVAACTLCFIAEVARGALKGKEAIVAVGALDRTKVSDGEIWRIVSATFLHGSFDHLAGNAVILLILGICCEHAFGPGRFALLYLVCGIAGSLASLTDERPSVGASGAIFGMAGLLIAALYRHHRKIDLVDHRIGFVLAIWALYTIGLGVLNPFVDNRAHFGGLVGGLVLGCIVPLKLLAAKDDESMRTQGWFGACVSMGLLLLTAIFFLPRLLGG